MLNNLFKKDSGLDENQVRVTNLVRQALAVGEGQRKVLVLFDPRHYSDYVPVHAQFMRLKDESDTIQYSCKQVVEQDISNYLRYIENDLSFTDHGKENIFINLFAKSRSDIDFIIKSIIDKQIAVPYFVI